jgi:hypothetical protein
MFFKIYLQSDAPERRRLPLDAPPSRNLFISIEIKANLPPALHIYNVRREVLFPGWLFCFVEQAGGYFAGDGFSFQVADNG